MRETTSPGTSKLNTVQQDALCIHEQKIYGKPWETEDIGLLGNLVKVKMQRFTCQVSCKGLFTKVIEWI